MKLDFNETNILIQNLQKPDKEVFLDRLSELIIHTEDLVLRDCASALRDKVFEISDEQLQEVFTDLHEGRLISTKQYNL